MTTSATPSSRVNDMVELLREGRMLDAVAGFYAIDAVVEIPKSHPLAGRDSIIAHRKALLDSVAQVLRYETVRIAESDDGSVFLQTRFEFESNEGEYVSMDEIAVQTWVAGRIVFERIYRHEK